MNTETIERSKAATANSRASRASRASKQIGWAVKLHITYDYNGHDYTDSIWVQGETKAKTLANAITERTKQQSLTGTVSCWIESEMFPVTKPLL